MHGECRVVTTLSRSGLGFTTITAVQADTYERDGYGPHLQSDSQWNQRL